MVEISVQPQWITQYLTFIINFVHLLTSWSLTHQWPRLLPWINFPDSKAHGANMGPIWGRQATGGPHVGPMNFVIWVESRYGRIVTSVLHVISTGLHDCLSSCAQNLKYLDEILWKWIERSCWETTLVFAKQILITQASLTNNPKSRWIVLVEYTIDLNAIIFVLISYFCFH